MSRIINYWWDYRHYPDGKMTVIVECDHPKADGKILGEFNEISMAEQMIAKLKSGQISMHKVLI